ncbi:MAG TPA: dihydroorotate dehydrogenase electron transfer subunit [Clostridiales bacterium]|nr:dihydroorotate dehydrogenase electron transfer subunit [Clostridiales bacterium]
MLREDAEKIQTAIIVDNRPLVSDVYHLILKAPKLASEAKPGQFVMVKVASGLEPTLRRPFSLHRLDRRAGQVEIIYQVIGKGTDILTERKPGEQLEILGPLGNGFCLQEGKRVGLVGGGMGIAPLLAVAEQAVQEAIEVVVFLGARTGDYLLAKEEFEHLGQVFVVTDDGSVGEKALVSKPLEEYLQNQQLDLILACGPTPMLKALAGIVETQGIKAQLSLEQRMGCGVGACLGCAFPVKAATPEGYTYKRVCHDGPVFGAHEVLFSVPKEVTKQGGCSCGQS